MNGLDANSEPALRLGVFALVLSILFLMEVASPRRKLIYSKSKRWRTNFSLSITNTLIVSVFLPIAGVRRPLPPKQGWGFFNTVNVSPGISVPFFLRGF
ncbi:MAG: hypothetical protein CM1200mP40_16900 [Gammaproteobacteria bacterium]|nr:MAG: hypothetical protein CM1200mP40_16900 [Gammaproteobacteria bacterium]